MARINIDVGHEVLETYRADEVILEVGDDSIQAYKAIGEVMGGCTLTDFGVNDDGTLSLIFKRPGQS